MSLVLPFNRLQAVYQSCQCRFFSSNCVFVVDTFHVCSVDSGDSAFQSNCCYFFVTCVYSNDNFFHSCFHLRFDHFVSQCFFVDNFDSFLSGFDISQCNFLLIIMILWFSADIFRKYPFFYLPLTTFEGFSLRHGWGLFHTLSSTPG